MAGPTKANLKGDPATMKRLLGALAAALVLAVALAPPALASPADVMIEKYAATQAVVDHQAPMSLALEGGKISPVAEKSAGKKKAGEKDQATDTQRRSRAEVVSYPLRL